MTDIEKEEVDQLLDTLRNLPLPAGQRALLDAITTVAGDIQDRSEEADERAFSAEFGGAFTKQQAALVLEYVTARRTIAAANAIIQGPGTTASGIIRSPAATPPAIIRNPPADPSTHDES
jgi:hypothetical protein